MLLRYAASALAVKGLVAFFLAYTKIFSRTCAALQAYKKSFVQTRQWRISSCSRSFFCHGILKQKLMPKKIPTHFIGSAAGSLRRKTIFAFYFSDEKEKKGFTHACNRARRTSLPTASLALR